MGAATLSSPHPWKKPEPTIEDVYSRRRAEVEQTRLDWQMRRPNLLPVRVRHERLYGRACWTWHALKEIKRELEAKMITCLDVVQNPGDLVTGDTWMAAAERVEAAACELDSVKGAMRRMAAELDEVTKRADKMSRWLENEDHLEDPRYNARLARFYRQIDLINRLTGWPSDSVEHRGRIMELAELNGFPGVPKLKIRPGRESWSLFLASASTTEEMLIEAVRAWR